MNGTIQMIVNLRSRSVEFSSEDTLVNRNSCVLKSDCFIDTDLYDIPSAFEGESNDEKVIRSVKSLHEMGKNVGNLDFLNITRGGNKVYIHPEDISFITIKADGELAGI